MSYVSDVGRIEFAERRHYGAGLEYRNLVHVGDALFAGGRYWVLVVAQSAQILCGSRRAFSRTPWAVQLVEILISSPLLNALPERSIREERSVYSG